MREALLSAATLMLVASLSLSPHVLTSFAGGTTIVVPDDYPTIQGAINAARPGDTIRVRAGVYHERVIVDKPVNLIGEGPESTMTEPYQAEELSAAAAGQLAHFDLNYSGVPPQPDGIDEHSVTVEPGAELRMFFYYKEGTSGEFYVIRVYAEWDKGNYILNSDNDETIDECGWEAGGGRYDAAWVRAPSEPGTYRVRVLYGKGCNPPTWYDYDRLLGEYTVKVKARTPPPAPTARFNLSSLSIEPRVARAGEPVTISVVITNAGPAGGTYNLSLEIDGEVEDRREVSLRPGQSWVVEFRVERGPGNHSVRVGDLEGSFIVLPAPSPSPATLDSRGRLTMAAGLASVLILALALVARGRRSRRDIGDELIDLIGD